MDSATAEIVQIAILAGCATIAGVTAMGLRAWQRVAQPRSERLESMESTNRRDTGALEDLRREIAGLRDTTSRYDLAFDTALQRLENRIAQMEANGAGGRQERPQPERQQAEAAIARNLQ